MREDLDSLTPLKDGIDYYLNCDGLMVLTAHYLLRRGYCCGNGCQHCPYPKASVPPAKADGDF